MARKILLADDSVTAQNMGRRILSDAGYEVTTVNNGSAALKRIAESKPDLIVLDVYMPGYGGLEVCQRIRESRETARIPVLLTVGKLEPFKPDEARRVRADAFIVKPFEASELLTALTKLEDKIVPQPQPQKPGRFAKAIAAIEESGFENDEFGDVEKGWKNRIKIPPPHQKPVEPDEIPLPKTEGHSPERPEVEVPADITPEEVAAIEAAAAAFRAQVEKAASVEPIVSTTEQMISGGAASSTHEPSEAQTHVESVANLGEAPIVEVQSAAEVSPPPHEDDVAAALASLAPSADHAPAEAATIAGFAGHEMSGPRWIAESVAVAEEESSVNLEQEMEAAAGSSAAVVANVAAAESPATLAMDYSSNESQETPAAIASNFAMKPGQEDAKPETSQPEPAPVFVEAVAEVPAPEQQTSQPSEEAAYAAAAGASSTDASIPTEAVSHAAATGELSEAVPATPPEGLAQNESELAAAWANWKHVRDSVASPEFTSQLADAAASGFTDIRAQESSAPQNPEPPTAPEDTGAIASIVDSVLAELKPKLMEEIAKKMKK